LFIEQLQKAIGAKTILVAARASSAVQFGAPRQFFSSPEGERHPVYTRNHQRNGIPPIPHRTYLL